MSKFRILFILFLMALVCSCSSTKKKARDFLERESYDEAVRLYEKALKEDPNDAEAKVGLEKARDGSLDKALIAVRMARLAGNQQQALELLLAVLEKEKAWKHTLISKVAFTQAEESTFAVSFVQIRVKNGIQEGKPLLAESVLMSYKPIFQDTPLISRFDSLKKDVFQSGKASCSKYQSESRKDYPYFSDFLIRYCAHFAQICESCSSWSKTKLRDLYSKLDVNESISDLPADLLSTVRKDLQTSFESTAWYDNEASKKASLSVQGSYHYSHQKDLTNLVHQYQVREPYESWEPITLSRQVPYVDYDSVYNSVSNRYQSVPVTKYRTEYYTENQRVVRYRTVDKVYPYSALRHLQKIDLNITGGAQLGDRQVDLSFQDSSNQEGYEHNLNLSNIGLRPSKPQLKNKVDWVKGNSKKISQQFIDRSQAEWVANYCKVDSSTADPKALANQVQKCLRGNQTPQPAFVNEWYEIQLGLNYLNVEQMLSK